jgi:hypothetical protein
VPVRGVPRRGAPVAAGAAGPVLTRHRRPLPRGRRRRW